MPRRSWMLTRIEEETRQHHAQADGHRLALLEVKDIASYTAFLVRIAGFERAVEVAIANTPDLHVSDHLRSDPLVANDLPALGAKIPYAFPPPMGIDAPQALGWLYVLQRNTLLHGLIARQLVLRVPEGVGRAGEYLRSFEGMAGQRMYELGQHLEAAARSSVTADRIVLAAHDAFRAQHQWYAVRSHTRRLTPPRVPLAA